jgi:hypothetical protein
MSARGANSAFHGAMILLLLSTVSWARYGYAQSTKEEILLSSSDELKMYS